MLRDDLAPRIFFDQPVILQRLGKAAEPLHGRAHNLSRSGIFVRTPSPPEIGDAFELSFSLPGAGELCATAGVVRVSPAGADPLEPTGVALRFDAMDGACSELLDAFISDQLRPAEGERLSLRLGGVAVPIAARTQRSWEDVVAVDAELPFLRLGSAVELASQEREPLGSGAIRWVAVNVAPDTGVPRLNIGIELHADDPSDGREARPVDDEADDLDDPIHTEAFARHVERRDGQLRAEQRARRAARRAAAAAEG